jgi:DASS family divalent anion:Na+ symporter
LLFIRTIGGSSLGLGYALSATDMLLGTVIPSSGARAGGILFPITKSLAEAYDSHPGRSARRLGAFLMSQVYQGDVIVCTMFFSGQASNALIAKFANQSAGVNLDYTHWALGAIVPGLLSYLFVPWLIYRLYPPEVRHTPGAMDFARRELSALGPMRFDERMMLVVFAVTAGLWITGSWHGIHYSVVALSGVALLLLSGVLEWNDLTSERAAWDVFVWYGGLVRLAELLGESGLTRRFAEAAAAYTHDWTWPAAFIALLLIYFYAHYAFASITAHSTAMYTPFLLVMLAAGAPPIVAVLSLAYCSNLSASLTHYGTTPAPIYFGAGYVPQGKWWQLGLIVSVANLLIWLTVGPIWWRALGWW